MKDTVSVATGGRIVRTVNSGGAESLNGGDAAGTTLLADGLEGVYFGAIASGTVIDSGTQTVYQADARSTVVNSGGLQNLFIASAESTTVNSGGVVSAVDSHLTGLKVDGGTADLLANTTTNSATVTGGGMIELHAGAYQYRSTLFDIPALANATTIGSGGRLDVDGGVSSNSQIRSGGQEFVADGASHGSVVYAGGRQQVSESGVTSGTIVSASGEQDVTNGGTADGTVVNGGLQYVYQGGTRDTVIHSGGLQTLFIGGSENATVNSGGVVSAIASDLTGLKIDGGYVDLLPNATAESAMVGRGGTLEVDGGTTSGTFQYKFITFDTAASATSTTVRSGGTLDVNGGITSNSQILSGGTETVTSSGDDPASDTGTSHGSVVYAGGRQQVSESGVASGTIVSASGEQDVSNGGIASGTIVNGGLQYVYQGDTHDTVINSGGLQTLFIGGSENATVNSGGVVSAVASDLTGLKIDGGYVDLLPNATTESAMVGRGGTLEVDGGTTSGTFQYKFITFDTAASATSTTVRSGGTLDVNGGVTSSSQILNGGLEAIFLSGSDPASDTGTSYGSVVYSGGVEDVHSGGIASGTNVHNGGQLIIETGGFSVASVNGGSESIYGTATGDTITSGGLEQVYGIARGTLLKGGSQDDFGQVSGTSIYSGGNQLVLGSATGTIVHDGGGQFVGRADGDFGVASGTVLTSGGIQVVLGGTSVNTVIGAGATEDASDGTVSGSVISGGTLILEQGNVVTNGIRFAGTGGDLTLDGTSQPGTVISGFVATDRIDLHDIGYSSAAVIKLSKTNMLSITGLKGGTVTLNLDPRQSFFGRVFKLASDGGAGTVLTVGNAPPVANNDSYAAAGNPVLAESAKTGVLANDTDALRHVLSAALVDGPRHGKLALSGDGSFSYTPTTGFIGTDGFTYKAMDGTLASGLATVSLAVTAPAAAKPGALGSSDLQAAFTRTSHFAASVPASGGISLPDPAASGHASSLAAGVAAADPLPVLSHHSGGLV